MFFFGQAVGRIPDALLPGSEGNVALVRQGDAFLRALRHTRMDNEITLGTLNVAWDRRTDSTHRVDTWDIHVLDHSTETIPTLMTRYLFNITVPAPRRLIVRAHRIPPCGFTCPAAAVAGQTRAW
jgi:sortase (surface protein transpeptidase)